ncbi:MAG TPA: trehalose-6-phosphate synthase [Thermoanaerobaculia bacterium]|nr:trehalose-6-phosphate synthase [Thermoanaerobaculia bacterium]
MSAAAPRRLVVATQDLPAPHAGTAGDLGRGGLESALAGEVLRRRGAWVGAAVGSGPCPADPHLSLVPVELPEAERRGHLDGFCHQVLRPLLHDQHAACGRSAHSWQAYRAVNRRFAEAAAQATGDGDVLWVHDYPLAEVGTRLREAGHGALLAHYLHAPFPALDLYLSLPRRRELLDALLAYDFLGFQTERDLGNFLDAAEALRPSLGFERDGDTGRAGNARLAAIPRGVDFNAIAAAASRPEVVATALEQRAGLAPCRVVLGIDALEPCQGVPQKLAAFAALLEHQPELQRRVVLVQVVEPGEVAEPELKAAIERQVGEINGRFSRAGWQPVRYHHRRLSDEERLAWMRAADVALFTPTRDGASCTAQELCAARCDGDGILVLSEFAGAASWLAADDRGLLTVNPYDTLGTADAVRRALSLSPAERREHMAPLRTAVARRNVHHWVHAVLATAEEAARPRRAFTLRRRPARVTRPAAQEAPRAQVARSA